ncbi:MAG: hypothetical protein LE168_01685 [Endomicrobium sp.]|nr:hypothetical protein [Endomicrobium sp.]
MLSAMADALQQNMEDILFHIDLLIPRGSERLVKFIREHSLIPVLSCGKGLRHTYIDKRCGCWYGSECYV